MSTRPLFSLSTDRLDFGTVAPGTQPVQSFVLTNHTGGSFNFQVTTDQPWLTIHFGQQASHNLPIDVTVDSGQLPTSGMQTATIQIQAMGTTETVTVAAAAPGVAQSTSGHSTSSGSSGKGPVPAGSGPLPRGGPVPAGSSTGRPPQSPGVSSFSFSLPLAAIFLCLLFGIVHSVALGALQDTPHPQRDAAVMTVGFAVLYFLPTLAKFFFPSGTPLAANPTDPEQQALLHALSQVCQKTGTTIPRVYLRSDGSPNISSYGVYGRWAVLYVNRGLLQTIQDPDELQAPVAHEISHIRRFDTLLSCCLVPVLWIVKGVLACVHTVAFSTRKGMRHMRLSPAMLMMLMLGGRGMGLVGCLIGLFIVIAFAFMAVFFLTYAVMALGVLLAFAIACRLYSQHMEKAADIDAVQIVGDPDRVLVALAQSGDYWPAEKATVDQYVAQHLGNVANYTLNDVIRTVKSGGDPCSGVDWRERLFRSHPLLVERIANVVGIFGSKLA